MAVHLKRVHFKRPEGSPTANDDSVTVDWNKTALINVLNNDINPCGGILSIESIDTSSTQGIVTQSGNDLVYDPNGQFDGPPFGSTSSDSFDYTIVDSLNQKDTATVNITIDRQPAASPVANDDFENTDWNSTVTIPVLDNDTGTSISIQTFTQPSNVTPGVVTQSGNDLVYNPNGQFDGPPFGGTELDLFSYTIEDQFGQTDTGTVTVEVKRQPVAAPEANNDTATVEFNSDVTIPVLNNDIGSSLTVIDLDTMIFNTKGTVTVAPSDTEIIYDPNGQFNSLNIGDTDTDSFSYTVTDQFGQTDTANVTVTITNNLTSPLIAVDDIANTGFDSTITIPVLTNDTGTSIILQSVDDSGAQGTATISGSDIIYDPNNQFNGLPEGGNTSDSFTYTITDSFSQTDTATVTVVVEKPMAVEIDGSFDVSSEDSNPESVAFNTTGTRMFVVGSGFSDSVHQYNLTTAFDVTTASVTDSFDVSAQDEGPTSLTFNDDGTIMYVVGRNNDKVYQYNLGTGFDLSTASFFNSFDVSSEDIDPRGASFNTSGTRLFVVGDDSDKVYQYNLSTAFDITTASFTTGDSFDVSLEDSSPQGVAFNDTGSRMFVVGNSSNSVHQYNLGTNFDITTATFSGKSFDASSDDTNLRGVTFNDDGTRMYLVGTDNDLVHQYNLANPYELG